MTLGKGGLTCDPSGYGYKSNLVCTVLDVY